jgi:hypothetical protein
MTIRPLRHPVASLLAGLMLCLVMAGPAPAQTPRADTKTETKTDAPPPEAKADPQPEAKFDRSKYIIFIHAGPKKKDEREVKLISGALFSKGYIVRAPDEDQDELGGPGVDYFDESAKAPAQDVASTINEAFTQLKMDPGAKQLLRPRPQTKTKNPPNWLGVWLF